MEYKNIYYSFLSGTCGAAASTSGKLVGLPTFQGPLIILRVLFFILMIIFNGGVWTFYTKALQFSSSSLSATVFSSATNYFLSAVIGYAVFGEVTSLLWWSGMMLVLCGLVIIAKEETKSDSKELKKQQ